MSEEASKIWFAIGLRAAVLAERRACEAIAREWLTPGTMKLRAGEMTAQELRTASAIVTSIADAIGARDGTEKDV